MVIGLSLEAFTNLHVIISLIGLVTGVVVLYGLLNGRLMGAATAGFLATTIATSATGFLFPVTKVTPAHIVGAISLTILALAVAAVYRYRLAGAWRWIFVVTAIASLYLNAFVAVVQAFLKLAPLKALAPTGSEFPFVIAQGVTLLAFLAAGYFAVVRFKPAAAANAMPTRPAAT
jgi:hypothetical protein